MRDRRCCCVTVGGWLHLLRIHRALELEREVLRRGRSRPGCHGHAVPHLAADDVVDGADESGCQIGGQEVSGRAVDHLVDVGIQRRYMTAGVAVADDAVIRRDAENRLRVDPSEIDLAAGVPCHQEWIDVNDVDVGDLHGDYREREPQKTRKKATGSLLQETRGSVYGRYLPGRCQPVLDRTGRRLGSIGHADLLVDIADV